MATRIDFDTYDEINSPRGESDFSKLVHRRSFMKTGLACGLGAVVLGASTTTKASNSLPSFAQVAANSEDAISLPAGYSWHRVVSWGDPMFNGSKDFDHTNSGTATSQALAFGDNNDGMAMFVHEGRHLLAVNNEYTNLDIMFAHQDGEVRTDDNVLKNMVAHGVSLVEVAQNSKGHWAVVRGSRYNRRITPETPMDITGPARGHALLTTRSDPEGTTAVGTWNNCGNGQTPWGTYLTCEENFNGYFSSSDPDYARSDAMKRYGINTRDWGYAWARIDERFDISRNPNEPNRFGYIVEIDPTDPESTPKKHSAMGRFKHENVEVLIADNGKLVAYMGDDERGEYIYRYVSNGTYDAAAGKANSKLLEDGTLYVAKFHENGQGEWLALTSQTTGMSKAEICVHTRMAASTVKGTTMDRPEWITSNPKNGDLYCALTNNKNRGIKPNAGGDPTPVGGPNPRKANIYGQIVRWRQSGGDHTSTSFSWDLYVTAGNPFVHSSEMAGSSNINMNNMFNSPDGMAFDTQGRLWIQTDGSESNRQHFTNMGNNQMLVGDPDTGEIRRFMVGPRGAEVTGITWSPDRKTLFVGIQHPEDNFPHGRAGALPRSSVIGITRNNGRPLV